MPARGWWHHNGRCREHFHGHRKSHGQCGSPPLGTGEPSTGCDLLLTLNTGVTEQGQVRGSKSLGWGRGSWGRGRSPCGLHRWPQWSLEPGDTVAMPTVKWGSKHQVAVSRRKGWFLGSQPLPNGGLPFARASGQSWEEALSLVLRAPGPGAPTVVGRVFLEGAWASLVRW
jgi:hypothetical protein